MYDPQPPRAVSAAAAIGVTAAMVAVLVFGFGVELPARVVPALVAVDLAPPPPPPPLPKPKQRPAQRDATKAAPRDEAGQRNLKNRATAIVAPPVVPLIVPPPVVTAPVANVGSAPQTGASDRPGPGQGAGRFGNGLGGGGTGGDGDGDGGGEPVQGPRRVAGRISYADLPETALPLGAEADVTVVFAVNRDGSASQCRIERASGFPAVDSLTCRLIEQRFRYRPAIDRDGRPVRSFVRENHSWFARER